LLRDFVPTRSRRYIRCALTLTFALWVGGADILASDCPTAGTASSRSAHAFAQFRFSANLAPQLCRLVPCRQTVRVARYSDEEQDASSDEPHRLKTPKRASTRNFNIAILAFRIVQPDYLIELPGTPPPVRLS